MKVREKKEKKKRGKGVLELTKGEKREREKKGKVKWGKRKSK